MRLELREKKGKKYELFLNGERYCRCYSKDLQMFGFSEISNGQEIDISESVLAGVEQAAFIPRAKKRALFLLGKKEYTYREMKTKLLTDGYPATTVTAVLQYLADLRYVDDSSYAERYALYLLSGYSERQIYQKMQQKGFEKDLIKSSLEAARQTYRLEQRGTEGEECEPELDAIRSFLRKKGYHPELADEETKRKCVTALYRKGFSLSDIRTVIGECEDSFCENYNEP